MEPNTGRDGGWRGGQESVVGQGPVGHIWSVGLRGWGSLSIPESPRKASPHEIGTFR